MQTEQQSLRAAAGQRFWQIDALRGLALLNMLVYHAMYDWVYIFGHASGWYDIWSTHCHVWQQYICWSFILLSGYSFTLSRRPLKNGLLTAACAVVLTVATAVAMPEEVIWFGVLHLLGCAALLTCLLHPALEKLPPLAGVTGSAVLFALLPLLLGNRWAGLAGVFAMGLLMYLLNTPAQMHALSLAEQDYPFASSLCASVQPVSYNFGIAIGSFIGSAVQEGWGFRPLGLPAAMFALAALGLNLLLLRANGRRTAAAAS